MRSTGASVDSALVYGLIGAVFLAGLGLWAVFGGDVFLTLLASAWALCF